MEHADTFLERAEAVRAALSLGMPIEEIEAYLDWLDTARPPRSECAPDSTGQTGESDVLNGSEDAPKGPGDIPSAPEDAPKGPPAGDASPETPDA